MKPAGTVPLLTLALMAACGGATRRAETDGGPSAASGGSESSASAGRPAAAGSLGSPATSRAGTSGGPSAARGGSPGSAGDGAASAGTNADEMDAGGAPATGAATLESALRDYRTWQRSAEEPRSISSEILSLCRLPTSSEQAFAESEHGMGLYLLNWLNQDAVSSMRSGGPFSRGSAIVKEKLAHGSSGGLDVVALGIMLKREPGFDPAHGDWSFGYWQAEDGLRSGAEAAAHCGSCHTGAKTDFVFVDSSWRLEP